ncbi:dihydrofolate reductase [Cytobacillus gottheilii]|uniref:dihydrofolate reductase n=1 Tax=Cytobacillus gottheilii TaxID=859144 RepID=UPI0015943947|nr:dihydrofolate reductase [Cytobacillus gottheilii]
MSVNIIVAYSQSLQIGYQNELLCKLPNDLKRFKEMTQNNYVVMGRRTLESLPSVLSNRHNIILTRNKNYKSPTGTFVYHSLEEVIEKYHNHNADKQELWIIGGSEIYNQAMQYADKLYITRIEHQFEHADTYFPKIDLSQWRKIETVYNWADKDHEHDYTYLTYERKN